MCLSYLSEQPKLLGSYKERIGWKRFDKKKTNLRFIFRTFKGKYNVPLDEWLEATSVLEWTDHMEQYKTGFHIYLTPKIYHYEDEIVRKVKFKNPIVTGYQDSDPVVVAKEMFVPGEKSKDENNTRKRRTSRRECNTARKAKVKRRKKRSLRKPR